MQSTNMDSQEFWENFYYSDTELAQTAKDFAAEIHAAEKGSASSLSWLVTEIPTDSKNFVAERELLQVMAIGGSNYHSAVYLKQAGSFQKQGEVVKLALPKFRLATELFEFISANLQSGVSKLALNFAYGIEPVIREGRIDGKLVKVSKAVSFEGLMGKLVGQEIESWVKAKSERELEIFLMNDVTNLVLVGHGEEAISRGSKIAGAIVGTGFNMGLELTAGKIPNLIINLEAGEFNKLRQTESGEAIDSASLNVGLFKFEKEVAGAHLWQHYNFYAPEFELARIQSTNELDEVSYNPLAAAVLKRSADLVGAAIVGVADYLEAANLEIANLETGSLTMFMEGSLFWDANGYKESVEERIQKLAPGKQITFKKIEQSYLLGPLSIL